jgi:hypothetical protein
MAGELQPLAQNFKIVDENGFPTLYFIKWAQQRQIDITESISAATLEEYFATHMLQEGSGIQFTPDGNIAHSPIIAADVQEILDQITSTRGAILYRGLLGWSPLLPGAAGNFLKTQGAGADPVWAAVAAGGGGYEAGPAGTIPAIGGMTGWNLGTSSIQSSVHSHIFFPQTNAFRGYYQAVPAAPFDIYMRMVQVSTSNGPQIWCGGLLMYAKRQPEKHIHCGLRISVHRTMKFVKTRLTAVLLVVFRATGLTVRIWAILPATPNGGASKIVTATGPSLAHSVLV